MKDEAILRLLKSFFEDVGHQPFDVACTSMQGAHIMELAQLKRVYDQLLAEGAPLRERATPEYTTPNVCAFAICDGGTHRQGLLDDGSVHLQR